MREICAWLFNSYGGPLTVFTDINYGNKKKKKSCLGSSNFLTRKDWTFLESLEGHFLHPSLVVLQVSYLPEV